MKKIGRFQMTQPFLDDCIKTPPQDRSREAYHAVMRKCFVMECRYDAKKELYEYLAYSDAFDQIDCEEDPPLYRVVSAYARGSVSAYFERVPA